MHMAALVRETHALCKSLHNNNSLKTRINSHVTYCIKIFNLQTQYILMSQSYSCFAKRNSTIMVIITLTTILNEKLGIIFAR